jgi:hypothetical protein
MTTARGIVLARPMALVLAGLLGACGASGPTTPSDGGDEAGDADATDASALSCQAIRLCVADGQGLELCMARGTPAAQTTFAALLTCVMAQPTPACTGTDLGCTCPEECYADGLCLDQAAACVDASGATADLVCQTFCGG